MLRNLVPALLLIVCSDSFAEISAGPCRNEPTSEAGLDEALESSNLAFVATVFELDDNERLLRFQLHPPPLKGDVPPTGELLLTTKCWVGIPWLNGTAILVLFLDSLEQEISRLNWQLVALAPDEPGLAWVSDWLAANLNQDTGS